MNTRIQSERTVIAGPVGGIEVLAERPDHAPRALALIGHPHPLFGGTMENKVVVTVARALRETTKCDKLNVAALGNVVPQLHVHVIARRKTDAAWPRPVWGAVPPLNHDPEELKLFMAAMRKKIWLG